MRMQRSPILDSFRHDGVAPKHTHTRPPPAHLFQHSPFLIMPAASRLPLGTHTWNLKPSWELSQDHVENSLELTARDKDPPTNSSIWTNDMPMPNMRPKMSRRTVST